MPKSLSGSLSHKREIHGLISEKRYKLVLLSRETVIHSIPFFVRTIYSAVDKAMANYITRAKKVR